ncbi:hypothetical protein MSG28_003755 [Choristoneura fumiferana]|uniref:Uncharacterized protein n=1 Tax=Choristoneura fumiferana TaxID=7141 RepID=A0ACC0KH44_CHOFU|nr:hypothetical protein MSG28_003755 [Choristoneura fumiferana]
MKNAINDHTKLKHQQEWKTLEGLKHSKRFIENVSTSWTKKLWTLSRKQLRHIVGAFTGHFNTKHILVKMGLQDNEVCRICGEEDETMEHIMCECDALARSRMRLFGDGYSAPGDFKALPLRQIIQFMDEVIKAIELSTTPEVRVNSDAGGAEDFEPTVPVTDALSSCPAAGEEFSVLTNCCGIWELKKASLAIAIWALLKHIICWIIILTTFIYYFINDDDEKPSEIDFSVEFALGLIFLILVIPHVISVILLIQGILKPGLMCQCWAKAFPHVLHSSRPKPARGQSLRNTYSLHTTAFIFGMECYFHLVVLTYYREIRHTEPTPNPTPTPTRKEYSK